MLHLVRALQRVHAEQGLAPAMQQAAAAFSTVPAPVDPAPAPAYLTARPANPQDYSMVMKKAAEIGAASVIKPNDKEVGLVTGIPLDTFQRKARIYTLSRSASQQGLSKTIHNSSAAPGWRIAFETTAKWENPLMGWTSTADPLENVARTSLFFYNKEEAMAFCKKHGWEFTVDEPAPRSSKRQKRFLAYGDNYSIKRAGLPDLSHLPSNQK
eukprot:CAMPEP_0119103132 /NCGR_PEP_ID=MMETSP1180-20130426/1665_1 /TAXON_ID=3052 ORGANISM="Chlamydomonas cf sp, Strain CCMP681" /NCGR_SAMPLE_ID=MMETSP1180 /ASSEMBLY_ACC=CAM_ASM_000741 /LENGTH=211 /DNA_ID=CAMNT_0007087575 /DNA_START=17 /DNA_END=652 /DNA_ORIENTATION=+